MTLGQERQDAKPRGRHQPLVLNTQECNRKDASRREKEGAPLRQRRAELGPEAPRADAARVLGEARRVSGELPATGQVGRWAGALCSDPGVPLGLDCAHPGLGRTVTGCFGACDHFQYF